MKTADSIEAQTERKEARDNRAEDPRSSRENTPPVRPKLKQRDASRIAAWRWQPGHCPNPGGRPKHDLAAEIARAVFENNAEALYRAFCKTAMKGNAYAFKELADRAYGRLKETHAIEHSPYKDLSNEDLEAKIKELKEKLGWPAEPRILPPADDDGSKPN